MKRLLSIFVLLLCCVSHALAGIDYIGQALDLSQLANGTSTEVVIRAAGNDASDASYGFVYYSTTPSPGRFIIDTGTATKDALKAKDAFSAYTFTLIKTADGKYRLQEHVNNNYLPGYASGNGPFSSSNNTDTFTAENVSCVDYLDNTQCYSLTYSDDGGFTVLKASNYFQVNNSNPELRLQFFCYASADKYTNFPALYSDGAISTLRSSLASAQNDNDVDEAIETLFASANNKVITIKSTTTAYSGSSQGTEYLYVENNDAKTASEPSNMESEYFLVEYAGNSSYRLKSWANNQYLAPTTGKSAIVDPNKTQAEAGLYSFLWNAVGSADSHVVLACQNATGNEAATYYALHRNSSHNLVTWTVDAAASFWTIEPVDFTITYRYVKADDQSEITTATYEHMSYGAPLPEVEAQDGYMLLTQVEGTVEGTQTYTIVCLDLNGEDQADAVKPATVNLTYQFVGPDGTVWYEEVHNGVENDAAYPAFSSVLPYGVSASVPTGGLSAMSSEVIVKVPCTVTNAFKFADSYEHIKSWYNVAIHNGNKFLFNYNESDTYMTLSETTGTTDKYLFAFVGNPFDGYKIYNRAAGSSKVLSAPNPTVGNSAGKDTGEDATPVMTVLSNIPSGNNTNWDVIANGAGFSISRHGDAQGYLNQRDDAVSGKNVLAFWTHANAKTDNGSRIFLTEVIPDLGTSTTTTETPTGMAPAHGKVYRIYNSAVAGYMISENLSNNGLIKTNTKTIHDGRQMWVALQTDATSNGYQLINVETGRYMQSAGTSTQSITSTAPVTVYLKNTTNESGYGICEKADGSGSRNLNTNGGINNVVGWSWSSNGTDNQGSNWIFEEIDYGNSGEYNLATIKERIKANDPYVTLTSGNYYRLVNKLYPTRRMVEDYASNNVRGLEDYTVANLNSQIWKIEGSNENGYTLQNVFTGNYIQYPASGKQFTTTAEQASAKKFLVTATGSGDWSAPAYAFYHSSSNKNSLHCENTWNIVTWTYEDASASFWYLEPVELTPADVTAIQEEYAACQQEKAGLATLNANVSGINAALNSIFTDASCSELRDTYKNLSDYRIGLAIDALGLPETIKQMALHVKHNTWVADKDATYNKYVRDFRIAEYEPYSDCTVWQNITKVGPFGCATNPSGITVKTGDVLYVYVSDDVRDNGAELKLEILDDTNRAGTRSQALHKGFNTYLAPHNGEVFVFYNVTNPDKYVYAAKGHEADYPNIRVHIEGGEATGMWDAHRGMTDEQWDWLCANMFGAKFLHIKGNNTLIHCVADNVRTASRLTDVMKIYDFIFMTEERLIGHDGQWDGRYKPVMCYRDGYSGNPNWGGGSVNIPGIGEGALNFDNLMNERWVIYHEEAHGHQYPINLVATTESSNNGFAQMVNHEFGVSSRRGNGVKTLIDFKNNGWGWVDMLRGGEGTSRSNNFEYYDDCVWLQNHLFYQLYLYFHVAGNMPDFWPRLCDKMRENGGLIQHGNDPNNPTLYYEDYFKFARACTEVSETDLSDFFDTWGFFGYYEDVKVGNTYEGFSSKDNAAQGIRFVGDYGCYYLKMPMKTNQEDVNRIEELKTFMKSQSKKAPNIMFIDDHILPRTVSPDSFAAQLDPSRIGQVVAYYNGTGKQGDFGDYAQFTGTNEANALDYSIEGTTVTMSGSGLVGVKIYDGEGNLKYIYNTETFTVPAEVATALANGTMTLVAALGNDTNLPLAKPSAVKHKMIVYNGSAEDTQTYFVTGETLATVPYSTTTARTDVPVLSGNAMALLPDDHSAIDLPLSINRANTFVNIGTEENPSWQATYVTLTDKQDFYLPEGNYKVAGMLAYSRTNTAGLNSVCLPFDTKASDFGIGAKAYVLKEVGDDTITFTEVTDIPAGTFAIIDCGTNGAEWQLSGSEMSLIGTPLRGNTGSYGAFQNAVIGEGKYKLNSAGDAFGITTASGKVTAFRGYIAPEVSGQSRLRLVFGGLETIGDVNGDGRISIADLSTLIRTLQSTQKGAKVPADVNRDANVDGNDIPALINLILQK